MSSFLANQPQLASALVGALSALVVMFIRDVVVEERNHSKRYRRTLVEQKLSQVYGPLWIAFGGRVRTVGKCASPKGTPDKNWRFLSSP